MPLSNIDNFKKILTTPVGDIPKKFPFFVFGLVILILSFIASFYFDFNLQIVALIAIIITTLGLYDSSDN